MENLITELEQVKNDWRIVQMQWNETSSAWNDSTRVQFEKQYWQEISRLMPAYIKKLWETSEMIIRNARDISI
jgi:hypothetical protein